MNVKDSQRERFDLYLHKDDPDDQRIIDHLENYKKHKRAGVELRRLLLLALEVERTGNAPRRAMGLAPASMEREPLALPRGNRSTRRAAPVAIVEETPSTPDEVESAAGNFLNMFG